MESILIRVGMRRPYHGGDEETLSGVDDGGYQGRMMGVIRVGCKGNLSGWDDWSYQRG